MGNNSKQKLFKQEKEVDFFTGDDNEQFVVTSGQRAMWFLYKMNQESAAYNFKHVAILNGEIHIENLKQALTEVVYRHPILRTVYSEVGGRLSKKILPLDDPNCFQFTVEHLINYSDEEMRTHISKAYEKPFNLESGPVLRVHLFKTSSKKCIYSIVIHHIATDFTSLEVIEKEIGNLYTHFNHGGMMQKAEPEDGYHVYAKWENEVLGNDFMNESKQYWKQQLSKELPVLNWQTDKIRTRQASYKGGTVAFTLERELASSLKVLAEEFSTTPYRLFMAAYFLLLYRYTGQSDIIIGSPISLRKNTQFQDDTGYFVNMLPFRLALDDNLSFVDLLSCTNEVITKGLEHAKYPFSEMVSEANLNRDFARSPVFQTSFTMQRTCDASLAGLNKLYLGGTGRKFKFGDFKLESFAFEECSSQYEVALFMEEVNDEFYGWLMYQADLFNKQTIVQISKHFTNILSEAVINPRKQVKEFNVIDMYERNQILNVFNNVATQYEKKGCINEIFEQRVAENPDAIAVTCDKRNLTYAELNCKANQLAHYLIKNGVGPEVMVPICLDPGILTVVGVLAILKAGGAYVPLNSAYPKERIAMMLEEIQPNIIITEQNLKSRFSGCTAAVLTLDNEICEKEIARENSSNPALKAKPDNTAYIIYTSGSTGKPKGVVVTHYNVLRLFEATDDSYGFNNRDVWTLFHSFAFDFSVWEIFGALTYGGRLVVVPYCVSRSPEAFYTLIREEKVTVLNQTPSAFRQFVKVDEKRRREGSLSLRYVIFGGEALELKSLEPWLKGHGDQLPRLVNMYGITETTVHVTYRQITGEDIEKGTGSVIGRPISDLRVYLLDKNQHMVPRGCIGEIYVGGAGVAKGYFKRDDLTQKRFIPDFISGDKTCRLYRSGDLAKFLPNGDIEYLGRIDHQVKIRGFRIELGDIESKLLDFQGVSEAVVLVKDSEMKNKRLIAYLVMKAGGDLSEIRSYMKEQLPDYMVPAAFVMMDALPMTPNGKIDKKALPDPKDKMLEELEFIAPMTVLQREIAEIWQEILDIGRIGIKNNFFDLGGNSLLIVELHSILKEKIDHSLEIVHLFQYPTIEVLAEFIELKHRSAMDLEDASFKERAVRRRRAMRNRSVCERIS